jgi:malate synthase
MKVAGDPFKELIGSGWKPGPALSDPARYPVRLEVPKGPITVEGTRRNVRMLVEYVEGWLNGRGAKGIDSLAGKPGIHPALMEDLATGRMSTAQIAQRVLHRVRSDEGTVHDFALVRRLLEEETADIIRLGSLSGEAAERYRKASKIAAQWIRNYTAFDFRSLGSYTRADLERIAGGVEAF